MKTAELRTASLNIVARSDAELVQAAQAGSHEAFGDLVERYQTLILSLAFSLTGSFFQREELAQEVFITAWRQLPKCEPDRFRSWLYGITRNTGRNFRREQQVRRSAHGSLTARHEVPSDEPSPLDQVLSREDEAVVWRALREIPEAYRIPLVLYYQEEESVARVAGVLGLSENTVKQRLWRGRRLLHDQVRNTVTRVLARARARKSITASVVAAIALLGSGSTNAAPVRGRLSGALTKVSLSAKVGAVTMSMVAGGAFILGHGPSPKVEPTPPTPSIVERSVPNPSRRSVPIGPGSPEGPSSLPIATTRADLLAFDFEDGILPAIFREGHLVSCPDLSNSRFCVLATPVWQSGNHVLLGSRENRSDRFDPERDIDATLFHFSPTAVLAFDYRIDARGTGLLVQLWNNDTDAKYTFYFSMKGKTLVYGAWAHAELRLAQFVPKQKGVPRFKPGDGIRNIAISAGKIGGGPFYIDNIQVIDPESPARP
jgi:RNA polymerase sigma factor (sigma-70 family)